MDLRQQTSGRPVMFEPLEARLLLDANPIITEFMADNKDAWFNASGVGL